VVALQQLVVDAGFIIEAFRISEGGEFQQVRVSFGVSGQQEEMVVPRALFTARLLVA